MRIKNWTIQYAQKWLKINLKNAIKLTKFVYIAQMDSDRIRILRRVRKIFKFESEKATVSPTLYAKPIWVIQQRMEEDEEIIKMKKLTCDNRVDEVCRTLRRCNQCFDDYIRHLQDVNKMLLSGITLSEIIDFMQRNKYESIDWRNNIMPTNYDCYADLLRGTFKVQIDKDRFNKNSIKDVIFNNPATIVLWKDGTKTVVKCQKGDTYNPELGLAMCIIKKMCGNKGNYNDVFNQWLPKEGE